MRRRTVPVVLVSGVQESAMAGTALSLQLGLELAVSVRHTIDPERNVLTRVVSDLGGVIEREEIDLEHACVSCAIREDIVPTLERLAASGRWRHVVACLPVAAEATQLCRVICWAPRSAPHVAIAAVVTALEADGLSDVLLGEDLLRDRGLATSVDDDRGLAEVACAQVEYADLICLSEPPEAAGADLVRALARPDVEIVADPATLDAADLVGAARRHGVAEAWVAEVPHGDLPPLEGDHAWRMELSSDRPFHPERFTDELAELGSGPWRARGCFWLPTRPRAVCVWDSAGGQASVGSTQSWPSSADAVTRLLFTGLDGDRSAIVAAFERCLVTDAELADRGRFWDQPWDGLEPWLGPIGRAA